MSRSQSNESQSALKRNRLPIGVALTFGAAALGGAMLAKGSSTGSERVNIVAQPSSSSTPEATVAPTATASATPETKPTDLPSATPKATVKITHPATKAPTVEATKTADSMAETMYHMRNRKVGDMVRVLKLGEDDRLELDGPIYDEPSKSANHTDYQYLQGTHYQNAEAFTTPNGIALFGAVDNPNDTRGIFVGKSITVFNEKTLTTRQISVADLTFAEVRVDKVINGFGYTADPAAQDGFALIASNPTAS